MSASPLSVSETGDLQRRWRASFASRLNPSRSSETRSGFDWHTFSDGLTPCEVGEEARQAYRALRTEEILYILPHQNEDTAYRLEATGSKPDFSGKRIDVYIVPPDFSWTMVYTHEQQIYGPYWARLKQESSRKAERLQPTSDASRLWLSWGMQSRAARG